MIAGIIITHTSCSEKMEPVSKEGYYLDTVCNITVYSMEGGGSQEAAEKVIDGAYKVCADYEKKLSKTIPESEIYQINHSGGAAVAVDDETAALINKAVDYGKLSKGQFDVTIGRASDLWNFQTETPSLPDDAKLKAVLPHIDYRNIKVDGNKVSLTDPESEIDLGGIAKGYIADKMADYMEKNKVTGAVINLGGNVYALGYKDGKSQPFKIGIRKPFDNEGNVVGAVEVGNKTVVTSGSYERGFKKDGVLYHHILDPKTGYPKNSGLASVTIIGGKDKSVDCDALATICFMLGPEEGMKLINGMKDYQALFVTEDGKQLKSDNLEGFSPSN